MVISRCSPSGIAIAVAAAPAMNATAPTTRALAISASVRFGIAASVVRISPRRNSLVMNSVATITVRSSATTSGCSRMLAAVSPPAVTAREMSPEPRTANELPAE